MKLKQLFETELYKFYCSKSNGFITSAASLTPEVISTMKKHSEKTGYPVEVKKDGKVVGKITKSGMGKLNESEITKGKTKQLREAATHLMSEGVEDTQAGLVDEFTELSKKHRNHADFVRLKKQFDRGMRDFKKGYEKDDEDLIDNGIEGMEQAVEDLKKI